MAQSDQIRISTEKMSEIQSQLMKVESVLSNFAGSIGSLSSRITRAAGSDLKLSGGISLHNGARISGGTVKTVLGDFSKALNHTANESSKLAGDVSRASDLFADGEKRLVNLFNNIENGNASRFANSSAAAEESGAEWDLNKLLKDIIAEGGILGMIASGLMELPDGMLGLSKFLIKTTAAAIQIPTILDTFSRLKRFGGSTASDYLRGQLLGLQKFARANGFNPSKAASAATRFGRNFSKAFAKGITSPVNWALQAVESGFDNFAEWKGGYKSTGTAVAEWATETAVGVTATVGAVAAVGALLPAAPVVAVGAIGAGIVWGVDTLYANTLGKGQDEGGGNEGLFEAVGEGLVDVGKNVGKAAGEAFDTIGKNVGSFVQDGMDVVASWF